MPAGRHSRTLAKLAALEAARSSFESAHDAITRRCGPVIGKRQAEESVVLTAGEKPNRKRMATLVTVCDAEPAKRRPHDVIAPPGGRHGARALRPGPKALAKWLAGSVPKDLADMIAAAFNEAQARDPLHQRTRVVLVDGAEYQLGLIRAEAARRGVTIHVIIDIIHVLEYISDRAAAQITAEADAASLTGSQRNGAAACVRYLTGKREFLRYDQALNAGWPIATGVIEGACRHLIADRLSIGGARWGLDGAEAVLTLRAVISNGDFEEYWRFHLACEHQRLYPALTRDNTPRSAPDRPAHFRRAAPTANRP
jgi:hypothetical protein